MIQGLYSALSALSASVDNSSVISDNVANLSSAGYKAKYSILSELSNGGVRVLSVKNNDETGYFINTGNKLDLAINGKGYFKLSSVDGEKFTRMGNFYLDKNGDIVSADGSRLTEGLGVKDGDNLSIDLSGNVVKNGKSIGRVDIFDKNGDKMPQGSYEVMSGFLESSNVDMAKEIVNSILNMRFFQANIKSVQTADQMLGYILDIKS